MIKFRTTVHFRDDTKKIYTLSAHPQQSGNYWCFDRSKDRREYVPQETIKKIEVTDYWENE